MSNPQPPKPLPQGAPQIAAGEPGKVNGTQTVVIGCKLPLGLLCELGKVGDEDHHVVRLNGSNSARIVGGYGLTTVSKDFWDAWFKDHRSMDFVKKGFVFAHGDEASAIDHATERAGEANGLEALDPNKAPKGIEVDKNHMTQAAQDFQFARQARAR